MISFASYASPGTSYFVCTISLFLYSSIRNKLVEAFKNSV